MSRHPRLLIIAAGTTLRLAACSEREAGPDRIIAPSREPALSAVKFWDANATANWNELATTLAARRPVNVLRLDAYLSLAQLRAAEDAEALKPSSPTSAAIGAASASVLESYFPADVALIEGALAAAAAAEPWAGATHQDFALSTTPERAAAVRVLAFSKSGTPPTTPGHWLWSGGPIARGGSSSPRAMSFFRHRRRRSARLSISPQWPKCVGSPTRELRSNLR